MPLRSEPLDDDPLAALDDGLDARRELGALPDEPPPARLEPDARLEADERLEPDARLEAEERLALEPDDPFERVDFLADEPTLRLARVPLDAAAARVWLPLERELRDELPDFLLASLRALLVALPEPLPLLALLSAAFRPVGLRGLFVVATMPTFPRLTVRYPVVSVR